ncbi:MAG: VTC domain-containing protein [Bacteroidetes bacterium]|nr:MAG: VTC domain-containing protein [Bacteroidota bacterium]
MELQDLEIFDPISLDEMKDVSLMKRTDTKFLVTRSSISDILINVKTDYKILQIGSNRLMTYNSVYFDTPESQFYHMHHNGISNRTKVRIRKYVESDLSFLEVKQKDSKNNTIKKRIKVEKISSKIDANSSKFIADITGEHLSLKKSIENQFSRFTLINKQLKERVTFDLNLSYNNVPFNDDLVIIELKQEKLNRLSPLFTTLKTRSINPYSISKYCIGMASTNSNLKQNLFKSKFLKIDKLTAK